MANKPGFLMEQQGQVIVATDEGAEGNTEEMVEEMCGDEERDNDLGTGLGERSRRKMSLMKQCFC